MRTLSKETLDSLVDLRHELHQHAELSSREEKTAQILLQWFSRLEPEHTLDGLGGFGLAFVFEGKKPGKTLLLRCELDALPIPEENSFEYRSLNPMVSHKCGHDGHMTILAAVGSLLSERRPESGRVILLFQPAEETGQGARQVLADSRFKELTPDFVFALHNLPKYALGEVLIRHETFHFASSGMVLLLSGKTSHAAHPEDGIAPTAMLSDLLQELSGLPGSAALQDISSLVTVTHAQLGEVSLGVAPGTAKLMAVLRAENDEGLKRLLTAAEELVQTKATQYKLQYEISWEEAFIANVSHPEACDLIEKVASSLNYPLSHLPEPIRWCEDFAEFTARYPGAMFGLGSGVKQPQLHNPDFDFPDELILKGASMFAGIIDEILD